MKNSRHLMRSLEDLPPKPIIRAEILKRARKKILQGDLSDITLEDVKAAIRIQERNARHAERLSKLTDEELVILDEITRKCAI